MLGPVSVLGAAVLWGTVGPTQVLAGSAMAAGSVGGWRLLVGGMLLGAFTVRPATLRSLASREALGLLSVCAVATALYQVAFLSSVQRTGAALATVVALGTTPAATGLCARLVTAERLGPAWVGSAAAAAGGCALLLAPTAGTAHADPRGLLLAVVAGLCYSVYTVYAKKLTIVAPRSDLPGFSALTLLAGAVPLLPSMLGGVSALHHPSTFALLAWLGVFTSAVAYWLFTAGLRQIKASTAGTLSLAEPLTAALLGAVFLHERLSPSELAGCLLIITGLAATCALDRPGTIGRRRVKVHKRANGGLIKP